MNGNEKLGFLEIHAIIAAITAFIGDIFSIFAIAVVIPLIGIPILFFALGGHYLAGIAVGATVFGKLKGFLPKIILAAGILLPLPTILLSLIIAIIFQSEIIQAVGIAVVGAATGGVGAVAAEGAEVAVGAEAAAGVAEVESAAAGTEASVGSKEFKGVMGAEEREGWLKEHPDYYEDERGMLFKKPDGQEAPVEELGERPEPMERLQRRLFEGTPGEREQAGEEEEEESDEDDEGVYIDGDEVDLRKV